MQVICLKEADLVVQPVCTTRKQSGFHEVPTVDGSDIHNTTWDGAKTL